MTTWHKGPPPSIGWWPASNIEDEKTLRWFDGKWWSKPAYPSDSAQDAGYWAQKKAEYQDKIKWSARWWE